MQHPPRIILVRPQMGENIGATARAMMNFGLSDLWLVAPRDGWPNAKAYEMSAHAKEIIERAHVVDTINHALHGIHYAYGASAQRRDLALPHHDVPSMPAWWAHDASLRSAVIFGPENHGLSNDDLTHCSALITIPTDARNTSLNLAQSVVIVAYTWFQMHQASNLPSPAVARPTIHATLDERSALYDVWWSLLDQVGYGASHPEKRHSAQQHMRLLLGQCHLQSYEVQMLHGMMRTIAHHLHKTR
ncbi:MAG: RNA methyltransferase [Alphaproteobacteria bacterium]|nr:MAG: RNA methyltransferase [Alphaproteobacteria bacterium]